MKPDRDAPPDCRAASESVILRAMRLKFTKMHGLGNDFIVFDAPRPHEVPTPAQLRRLADRRTGIGFDQALVLSAPRSPGTDVYYRIFNADGTEVEQCGNGARCIATLVARRNARRERPMRLGSPGGVVDAVMRDDGLVSVAFGVPDFDPRSLPFEAAAEAASYRIDLLERPRRVRRRIHRQSARGDPRRIGRRRTGGHRRTRHGESRAFSAPCERGLRRDRVTGARPAPGIRTRHGRDPRLRHGRLRRGCDRSPARSACRTEVRVDTRGGRLIVGWRGAGEPIWLTGPAETAFEGHVELQDYVMEESA